MYLLVIYEPSNSRFAVIMVMSIAKNVRPLVLNDGFGNKKMIADAIGIEIIGRMLITINFHCF